MANEKNAPLSHIFISYSHMDKAYTHTLTQALMEEGFEVWIDDRIDYGIQWPHAIQDNLDSCAAFIVIMTPRAYKSSWVLNELSRAQRIGKPIFPLLLEGDGPWLSVEASQYVDVRGGILPPQKFFEQISKFIPQTNPHLDNTVKTTETSQITSAVKEAEIPVAEANRTIKYTSATCEATTLLPVLNLYEAPKGIANVVGFAFGAGVPYFPPEETDLPVLTTWMGVTKPFDFVLKLLDPNGRIASSHRQQVEPSNDWGYRWCVSMFHIAPTIPGLYTLELSTNNHVQLKRPLIFHEASTPAQVNILNKPEMTVFVAAQIVNNVDQSESIDIKNIMGDKGFRKESPFTFLAGWSNCKRPLYLKFELLDAQKRTIGQPIKHTLNTPKVENQVPETNPLVNFQFHGWPSTIQSGLYWARLHYLSQEKLFPFLLY